MFCSAKRPRKRAVFFVPRPDRIVINSAQAMANSIRNPKSAIRNPLWPSTYFLAILLVASALLPLPQNNAIAGMPSICAFHNFTGLPCPGCGLTRSWVSMAHGQFANALVWHPLGPVLFLSALIYTFWSGWMALSRPPFPLPMKLQTCFIVGLSLVMLGFWALRLAGAFPLPGG